MSTRDDFEHYMRRLNTCTRMRRQSEAVGGKYLTTTVQRAWELWSASREQALNEAVELCISSDGRDYGMTGTNCADQIKKLRDEA